MATSRQPNVKAVIVSLYGTILGKRDPQPDTDAGFSVTERLGLE